MQVVVIDNLDSFVYNLVRYLKEAGAHVQVQRNTEILWKQLDQADGILLSPGPGIPSEAGKLMEVIERYANRKSILGICLGHQALAEYYGGTLSPCPTPVHGKASRISITHPGQLFQNIGTSMQAGRYHSWQAALPESDELIPLAYAEDHSLMAFEHRRNCSFGIQFHPESILTPEGRKLINNWIKTLK